MTALHITWPDNRFLRRRILRCPTCECRTEMVARYELWYGTTLMCCRCGEGWCDGERFPREFSRYWRRDEVRRYRQLWGVATYGPAPTLAELDPAYAASTPASLGPGCGHTAPSPDAPIDDQQAEDDVEWMWTPNCPRHDHHEAGQR